MREIIQGLWVGRPLSSIERLSITSFLRHGHEYHLYCYADVGEVPPGAVVRPGEEILPASEIFCYQQEKGRGSFAAFSNLFRYKLLLERGGWWADMDVVCLRPFDFAMPAMFASETTRQAAKLATAVIKLPRGHAIAARCYELAAAADRRLMRWGETGPQLLTRVVAESGFRDPIVEPEVFCPVPWWQWKTLLDADARPALSFLTDKSYAVHLWHEMWRRANATTFALPRTSLYAQLLERFGVV